MTTFIGWAESQLPDRPLSSVTWEEIRSYIRWLKDVKGLKSRTINVLIAQLRDFYYYVLHKDWHEGGEKPAAMQFLPRWFLKEK